LKVDKGRKPSLAEVGGNGWKQEMEGEQSVDGFGYDCYTTR